MIFHPPEVFPCPLCITLATCSARYLTFQDDRYPGKAKGSTAFLLYMYNRCSIIHDYLNPKIDIHEGPRCTQFKNFFERIDHYKGDSDDKSIDNNRHTDCGSDMLCDRDK